ncbi:MAG: ribonuclease P protein component [Verrucomicrobiota bacterium]
MAASFSLKPAQRLRRNSDFLKIRRSGKPYRCRYFAMYSSIRTEDSADILCPRIGISASRRVGNAVFRNKAKRRFRELFRLHQHGIDPSADILLSIRQPSSQATYKELEQRFLHAVKFLGLRKKKDLGL